MNVAVSIRPRLLCSQAACNATAVSACLARSVRPLSPLDSNNLCSAWDASRRLSRGILTGSGESGLARIGSAGAPHPAIRLTAIRITPQRMVQPSDTISITSTCSDSNLADTARRAPTRLSVIECESLGSTLQEPLRPAARLKQADHLRAKAIPG